MIRLYVIGHECAETDNLSRDDREKLMRGCDACLMPHSVQPVVLAIGVGSELNTEIGRVRVTGFELGGKVIQGEIIGGVRA